MSIEDKIKEKLYMMNNKEAIRAKRIAEREAMDKAKIKWKHEIEEVREIVDKIHIELVWMNFSKAEKEKFCLIKKPLYEFLEYLKSIKDEKGPNNPRNLPIEERPDYIVSNGAYK